MFKKKVYSPLISLAVATLLVNYANANGFALNEQSVSSASRAFVGRASVADDATTIYGNPAGMSQLGGTQTSIGFTTILGQSKLSNASASIKGIEIQGTTDGDMVPVLPVPAGYISHQLNNKWHIGVGFYLPYGVVTKYEDSFIGRYQGTTSEVKVLTLQPSVSYKFNDSFSTGLGLTLNHMTGKLESNIFTHPGQPDMNAKLNGSANAVGFNFGILANITKDTKLGFAYHSPVKYNLKGDIEFGASLGAATGDSNIEVTTPEIVDLSLSHAFTPKFTLHTNITYTGWGRLEKLEPIVGDNLFNSQLMQALYQHTAQPKGISFEQYKGVVSSGLVEQMQWKNTVNFGIAGDYKYNDKLTLRAGVSYFPSPVTDEYRNVRVPVGDRTALGLGLGYSFDDNLSIDLAYNYMTDSKVTVKRPETATKPSFNANYKSNIHLLALQLNYKF